MIQSRWSIRLVCLLALAVFPAAVRAADDDGFKPAAPDGKQLNLDFEKGSLEDWIATGAAFDGQPIKGDTVRKRRNDMVSGHVGDYWIGGYERLGDEPEGTLTSATVKVTHPFASFLVGGGYDETTRVEIVRKDTGDVLLRAHGRNHEEMYPVIVDLTKHLNKEIFIRLVDTERGGWGHINFDHFRFHDQKPQLAGSYGSGIAKKNMYNGLPAEKAAEVMTLPKGFKAIPFAAEPDVRQPIAMTIDDRGRLWVAEGYSYPLKRPEGTGRDRILIFEDANGDGRFDTRTVFIDKLNLVSGLEVGFGGVWIGQAPDLLFVPDRDGDDKPDGAPEILLDGWHWEDTHETLNAFIWGPDGWLYGCHGVFTHSLVGKPGTPDEQRIPVNAGIWRYHPTRHVFEVFANGTSNPWGVDFNDYGHSFLTCCVIPHLFHVIQGARYHRQGGRHFNPYTYDDIKTIAVHRHWIGNQWSDADRNRSDEAGGGHAHAGAMFYLADEWPAEYRNTKLFMNNIHGARFNVDSISRKGSGYEGNHAPDFLLANDISSQVLYLRYGPDGQVYFIDWYDENQCHHGDEAKHNRTNGRIYKIVYNNAPAVKVDLKKLSSDELVALQLKRNDWYVRHARRILQERGPDPKVHARLAEIAFNNADDARRLRGLWALHVTGGLTEEYLARALADKSEYVRGWAIQLAAENGTPSATTLATMTSMARDDTSQLVRLYLASALQRLPVEQRWEILAGLVAHTDDALDHNLPLMYWYALEPMVPADMSRAVALTEKTEIPILRSFTLRRIADVGTPESLAFLLESVSRIDKADRQLDFLAAISQALKGRRRYPMPAAWPQAAKALAKSANETIRGAARSLAVTFGDSAALAETRALVQNSATPTAQRQAAIGSLLAAGDPDLAGTLLTLLNDKTLRSAALRGLADYDSEQTPAAILRIYGALTPEEKRDALNTLSSRLPYAIALLDAVDAKKIPPTDLTAEIVRQIGNLHNDALNKRIDRSWGVVRDTAEDRKKLIEEYRALLTRPGQNPDVQHGRAVFTKTCAQCHKLFGAGGAIGPELTGSNRANLDYLLTNVIDPSAVMARDYQPYVIATDKGRIITGLVKEENQNALTVVTADETIVVPRNEIEEMKRSDKSMMPDNLWQQLKPRDIRALVAYLAGPRQVPLPATADNVKSFFNGRDLALWNGNLSLWKVENGEIVGTSPGLDHNEFLVNDLVVGDFDLALEVKLTPDSGNSGVQFRSELLTGGVVRGYQADIGATWWGKLYEEHGRALLSKVPADEFVRVGDWNTYRIVAKGDHIRTFLNGRLCVDLHDPQGARAGIIALQIHAGEPFEVRFRNLQLSLDPQDASAATGK